MESTQSRPALWADGPFPLVVSPRTQMRETAAVFIASEMANVHNTLLRGLNSIVRQAPYIPDASMPGYEDQDVRDLLHYTQAWCETLQHHHDIEESTFFPLIENMTGVPGLMDELEQQHEDFEYGFAVLREYVLQVEDRPWLYRWSNMKATIKAFAPALVHHLHDEIDFLLHMDKFDAAGLRRCWLQTEKEAMRVESLEMKHLILPFVLGNSDKSTGSSFPPLPKPVKYAIKVWYAHKYRGAWRFNCCDFSGQPVPLQMMREEVAQD